jgi:hypothetical protein
VIERYDSGLVMLCCTLCGRYTTPRRFVEPLLTDAIERGWTLINDIGEPQEVCPVCRGLRDKHRRIVR